MNSTSIFKRKALRGGSALQAIALLGAGFAASVLATAPASAQNVTSGSLSGTVLDQSGNPVQGATVIVTSTDRGFSRSATTSAGGTFNVNQLPIGAYAVEVSGTGFQTTRSEGIDVQLGGTAYNFTVGSTGDAGMTGGDIVVTGRAERTIDFSGTATGQVFNVQQVAEQLPVPRSIESIQLLAPQTTSGDSAFGGVSIAGSSVAENIFYINGMNVTNFRTFVGGTTVPFEFYDQVQVKTGGYQAEFGRNTGGAVIALTRSGSNEFKGGANIYWQPDWARDDSPNTYAANNSLDERANIEGNIWASGPLIKDRLFFFAFFNPRDYYTKDTSQNEGFTTAGASTGFTNTTVTRSYLNNPFFGGKLDLNLFDGHRVEATYFSDSQDQTIIQDGATTNNFSGGDNLIVKYTGAFTDWLTVSALYGQSNFNQTSAGDQDSIPYVLDGRTGALVYVAGNPAGLIETGRDKRENFRGDIDVNFSLFGEHQLRFGGDYEKLNSENVSLYSGGIYYRYYRTGAGGGSVNGVAVPGNTDYLRLRSYNSGGSFDSKNLAFYVQDSWDITPRLNLSLGVRYDKFENFNAAGAAFTNLDNQIAPRLGFSYDVFGDRRTKLTGFYGRYFLPVAANTNIRLAGNELFYEEYYRITAANALTNPTLGAQLGTRVVLSDSNNPNPATLVSQNLKPQFLDEFVFGLEHRLTNRLRVSVNGTYRKLGAVLEDTDLRYSISNFCRTQNIAGCNATNAPTGTLTVPGSPAGTILPSLNGATIGGGGLCSAQSRQGRYCRRCA